MGEQYLKYIKKLPKSERENLKRVISLINNFNLDGLDFKKMSGYDNLFRVRSGKFRILFKKSFGKGVITEVNTRGDIYKK